MARRRAPISLRSPPAKFAFSGTVLFAPQDVPYLAESAALPVPGDTLPETERFKFHRKLARDLCLIVDQAAGFDTVVRNITAAQQRADAMDRVAASGQQLLLNLGLGVNFAELAAPEPKQIIELSGVARELARYATHEERPQIFEAIRNVALLIEIAQRARGEIKSGPRGPRPNAFVRTLLEGLARHYREAWGKWPVLKNKVRERGGPALKWGRAVCQHIETGRNRNKSPLWAFAAPSEDDSLTTSLTTPAQDAKGPLFRTIGRTTRDLTRTPLPQANAYAMIRRRASAAGIKTKVGNHTFRATGITAYLKNGGTLEQAAAMANHASTRTTQLYDRRHDELTLDEVERIFI
jgi:integrase